MIIKKIDILYLFRGGVLIYAVHCTYTHTHTVLSREAGALMIGGKLKSGLIRIEQSRIKNEKEKERERNRTNKQRKKQEKDEGKENEVKRIKTVR